MIIGSPNLTYKTPTGTDYILSGQNIVFTVIDVVKIKPSSISIVDLSTNKSIAVISNFTLTSVPIGNPKYNRSSPAWQGSVSVPIINDTSSVMVKSFQAVYNNTKSNTVSITVNPSSSSCQNIPSGYVLYNGKQYKVTVVKQPSNIYQLIGIIGLSSVISPVTLPAKKDYVSVILPVDMKLNYNGQCYSYLNGDIPIAFGNTANNNQVWFLFPKTMEYLGYIDLSNQSENNSYSPITTTEPIYSNSSTESINSNSSTESINSNSTSKSNKGSTTISKPISSTINSKIEPSQLNLMDMISQYKNYIIIGIALSLIVLLTLKK